LDENQVSEVAREDRPDESVKRPVTPSKASLIGKKGIEHLSHSRSAEVDFLNVKTFIPS
jgi:hypothetical protein